ncbi:MAG: hypothetical protein V9F00_08070 [Nocardioides sp.]
MTARTAMAVPEPVTVEDPTPARDRIDTSWIRATSTDTVSPTTATVPAVGSRGEVALRSSLRGCGVEGRGVGGAQPGFVKALCSGSSGGCSDGIGVATCSDHSTSVEHESSDQQQRGGHADDEHRHGASLPTDRERSNAAPGHRVPR